MSQNLLLFVGRCVSHYNYPFRTYKRYFSQSYYDVLKVSPTCTSKEIREAFLQLSKKTHPDKHQNDPSMHEKFVKLNEAYSTLINPSSRRAYDLTLYNERKLNPPYGKPYSHTYTQRKKPPTSYESYESARSSKNSNANYYKDPFSWDFKKQTDSNFGQRFTSGFDEIKRFSNTVVVGVLLAITCVGAIIQLLAIRHSYLYNQEQMLEKSRQYSLIHKLAKERANLNGNAQQIEILKRNLASSYGDGNKDFAGDDGNAERAISNEVSNNAALIRKANEGKVVTPKSRGGHNVGGQVGTCAIHGPTNPHLMDPKSKGDSTLKRSPSRNAPCPTHKKCKKCGHKIN